MIVMYTDYDLDAKVLAACAQQFMSEIADRISDVLAPPDQADASHAEAILESNLNPFFFFGHGTVAGPTGQDGATIDFNKVPHLLSKRLVCATCCYSADVLEQATKHHAATGVAYWDKVWVFRDPPYSTLMQECLLACPRALARGESPSQAARNARAASSRLAQQLISGPIEDQVRAPFLRMNADRIRVFEI